MSGEYDFSGLTNKQQELLTFQGWNRNTKYPRHQPKEKTVKKLIERGLVIAHTVVVGNFSYYEYEVPLKVHAAWCAYCSLISNMEDT